MLQHCLMLSDTYYLAGADLTEPEVMPITPANNTGMIKGNGS